MEDASLDVYAPSRTSSRAVNLVRIRLREVWHHDPEFFTKFFPVNARIRRVYGECQKELRHRNRWKGVSTKPKAASKLYTPLSNIIGQILQTFGLYEDTRRVFNTSKNNDGLNPEYPVWPPLLLAGSGKHFVGSIVPRPLPDYALGISVLEVRLDNEDEARARDRLAASMQQLIARQYNRRYAFGLVISQHSLTVHMFDRSGAVSSPSLDYHAYPEQFCAIIAGLASTEASHLGLDTTIFRDGIRGVVQTREPAAGKGKTKVIDYTLIAMLYYSSYFAGRGTICFAAYEEAIPEKKYVIKDAWVATEDLEGKESEASLISHAKHRGVSKGIPEIRHEEEVQVKGLVGRVGVDSVFNNRRHHSMDHSTIERVHTRLVMSPFGKPLDRFSNRKELLLAYHDAIQAHRNLYEVGGILHRDIKPGNILINPEGMEGDRGVLIDFDHAIRTDDNSPYSSKKKIGTYLFMSYNALEGTNDHSYLDDLESFYYALLYVTLAYTAPGSLKKALPEPFKYWDEPLVSKIKKGFLTVDLDEKVDEWFGIPFQTLLERLHSIFQDLIMKPIIAEYNGEPPPTVNHADIYEKFILFVSQAIGDVEGDQRTVESTPPRLQDAVGAMGNARKRTPTDYDAGQEKTSAVFSWSSPRKRRRRSTLTTVVTLATSRNRRSRANYGTTKSHGRSNKA